MAAKDGTFLKEMRKDRKQYRHPRVQESNEGS